ncbi:MAG: carboxypeptidase regulatory-like domain-containing protein [bacterium]|nr:carboxypeptidase regulatory-like domain-containing protein [bacterium]
MFHKITLITIAVALGLAVFVGCSNDAGTSNTGTDTGELTTYWIEGYITENGGSGDPVEGAYIYILKNENPTLWNDYSDEDGFYNIDMGTNPGNGDYIAVCVKDPSDKNSPELEYEWSWPEETWHITRNFHFP